MASQMGERAMKWNAVITGVVGVAIVYGLVLGFTTGRFSNLYFDLALGGLILGFIVKTWQLSKYRTGSENR